METSRLEVTLAGAVTLRRGDQRLGSRSFRGRQSRLVTAMVMLERAQPVAMTQLAGELWPDQPPTHWKVAVRNLVSQLRQRLTQLGYDGDVIVGDQGRYLVDLGDATVDIESATADVTAARAAVDVGAIEQAAMLAASARSTLSRPVLPGVESDWLERLRDRIGHHHLESLVLLGECRRRLGAHAQARSVLAEAIAIDPLREDAWRARMRAEAEDGGVARALASYEEVRRLLADKLGVDPATETQRLHAQLLQGRSHATGDDTTATHVGAARIADLAVSDDRTPHPLTPYVGLRAFTEADANCFFGRDAEIQALVEAISRRGMVVAVGPSGVGKSSLVRAGLLPSLHRGAIPDSDTWQTVVMVPGSDPVKSLAAALATVRPDGADADDVRQRLNEDDGLHRVALHQLADQPPTSRLFLVVDQFEEAFTLADPADAAAFVILLVEATTRLDRRVSIVITLRADFYDQASADAGMADVLSYAQFVVPPLAGEQVEAAIVGPATRAGLSLEPGLLGRIATDVAGEPGSLPLLQHLLYELWERRVDHVLTRGAYDDLGGVAGALAHRAESVYASLDREQRAIARRVLLRAVQPGEDGADTRRPVSDDELAGPTDDDVEVAAVVSRLVAARLLTVSGSVARGPVNDHLRASAPTYEIAHEALIDAWPRLRAWVDQARGWLLDHRRLTVAANDWERHDRHDDWLLAGLPLDEAHELLLADGRGEVDLHLSPLEHAFVADSLAARTRDRRRDQERQDARRQLERRSVRRARGLVAVITIVALVAGGLWWNARRTGQMSAVRELATAAIDNVDVDPQRSLLLALEARKRAGGVTSLTGSVDDALHAAIGANRMVALLPDVGDMLAVSPDGAVIATAHDEPDPDGTWSVDLRDRSTGAVLHSLPGHGGDGPVWDARFSPDGTTVATGDRAATVRLWGADSGELLDALEGPKPFAMINDFSVDGSLMTVGFGTDRADVRVFVAATDPLTIIEEVSSVDILPLDPGEGQGPVEVTPLAATFNPAGTRLAVTHPSVAGANSTYAVRILDADDFNEVLRMPIDADRATWSPDGALLALAGRGGSVLVDPSTGDVVGTIPGAGSDNEHLRWSPDGSRLVDESGMVIDANDPDGPPLQLAGVGVGVPGRGWATFLPDGEHVATSDFTNTAVFDISPDAGSEVARLPASGWQPGIDFSPDGTRIAVSAGDGVLTFWNTATWQLETSIDAHERASLGPELPVEYATIIFLDWSPDGSLVATSGFDDVEVRDAASGEELFTFASGGGWTPVHFNQDSQHLAVQSNDPHGVVVIDRQGRQVAHLPEADDRVIESVRFSPDGQWLAQTVDDAAQQNDEGTVGAVKIWDWQEQRIDRVIEAPVYAVDWSPDGSRLALAGDGLGVWDMESDDWSVRMLKEGTGVQQAVFSSDGERLASCELPSGSTGGRIRVWDAVSGDQLAVLADDNTGFCRVRFSGDDQQVAVSDGGAISAVRVWTLDGEELATIADSRVVRDWTPSECRDYLHLDECPD